MTHRWIKVPGPGQFRGEGEWQEIGAVACSSADWEWNRDTHYLPTHEGDRPPTPEEEAVKRDEQRRAIDAVEPPKARRAVKARRD